MRAAATLFIIYLFQSTLAYASAGAACGQFGTDECPAWIQKKNFPACPTGKGILPETYPAAAYLINGFGPSHTSVESGRNQRLLQSIFTGTPQDRMPIVYLDLPNEDFTALLKSLPSLAKSSGHSESELLKSIKQVGSGGAMTSIHGFPRDYFSSTYSEGKSSFQHLPLTSDGVNVLQDSDPDPLGNLACLTGNKKRLEYSKMGEKSLNNAKGGAHVGIPGGICVLAKTEKNQYCDDKDVIRAPTDLFDQGAEHSDEIVSVVPQASAPCGFRLVFASTHKALKLLDEARKSQNSDSFFNPAVAEPLLNATKRKLALPKEKDNLLCPELVRKKYSGSKVAFPRIVANLDRITKDLDRAEIPQLSADPNSPTLNADEFLDYEIGLVDEIVDEYANPRSSISVDKRNDFKNSLLPYLGKIKSAAKKIENSHYKEKMAQTLKHLEATVKNFEATKQNTVRPTGTHEDEEVDEAYVKISPEAYSGPVDCKNLTQAQVAEVYLDDGKSSNQARVAEFYADRLSLFQKQVEDETNKRMGKSCGPSIEVPYLPKGMLEVDPKTKLVNDVLIQSANLGSKCENVSTGTELKDDSGKSYYCIRSRKTGNNTPVRLSRPASGATPNPVNLLTMPSGEVIFPSTFSALFDREIKNDFKAAGFPHVRSEDTFAFDFDRGNLHCSVGTIHLCK
jgi:hypothetical protein